MLGNEVAEGDARISQYFDGKKTDDEILFRVEISRKQLRHVLHHYDEHVSYLSRGIFRGDGVDYVHAVSDVPIPITLHGCLSLLGRRSQSW